MPRFVLIQLMFLILQVDVVGQSNSYTRRRVVPTYKAQSLDEALKAPAMMEKRHQENLKYLHDLQNWILELKPTIQSTYYVEELRKIYSSLGELEKYDLAREYETILKEENRINDLLSRYKRSQAANTKVQPPIKSTNTAKKPDYFLVGFAHYLKGDYAKAVQNYSRCLEADPNRTEALFQRAFAKSALKNYRGAIRDHDKVITLYSDYPLSGVSIYTVFNNKAYALFNLGRNEEAYALVNKALDGEKTKDYIWSTRAEIRLKMGDLEGCIMDATYALYSLNSKSRELYFIRGVALCRLQKTNEGCQDLSKAGELGESRAYDEISKYCQ